MEMDLELERMMKSFKDDFWKWANKMYGPDSTGLNIGIEKYSLLDDFLTDCPLYGIVCGMKRFKEELIEYCRENELFLNPHRMGFPDKRDKANGMEFYLVANKSFLAGKFDRIVLGKPEETRTYKQKSLFQRKQAGRNRRK